MRGFAEAVSGWFGNKARLRFVPWEEWKPSVSEKEASVTWDHIARSPNCSIAKAQRLLGYYPRYSPPEAVRESLQRSFQ
jgi:nucleoside-diphosphate-sugar epimerase